MELGLCKSLSSAAQACPQGTRDLAKAKDQPRKELAAGLAARDCQKRDESASVHEILSGETPEGLGWLQDAEES